MGSKSLTLNPRKRQKPAPHYDHGPQEQSLIPGLSEHVAELCLSRVHPSLLYSVCRSWRRLIYSPLFPPFRSLYTLIFSSSNEEIQLLSFDPISSKWESIPPATYPLNFLVHHPSFISRNLPVQSISVAGYLVLLAATAPNFIPALSRPLVFSPLSRSWSLGPPMETPRRWCVSGASGPAIYVASGIGSNFSSAVAKSLEKWDLEQDDEMGDFKWKKMRQLKDGRFSRDAIDAVGWRRKLCIVNVAKQGTMYDVDNDIWEEMPEGMVAGWRGPVAAMDEEVLYGVDESKGVLARYNQESDNWEVIMETENLRGARQMTAACGRLCVICGDGEIIVIDVVAALPRFWAVEIPPELEPLAVHVLPRLSRPDY
ncbi:F-box/kelch-repeat protein SKIP25 [Hibiscus syriacus]|uniref:F-box/kelch-repeat protein SKIP25 n=1 Tax=Hibiscus syriacus TaxID=106335 RepID=A0A6A2ZSI9_HIBSY|nr:F-box/kelch-repeat protein SKIP25-like [Hibiscus syriacus]KAE8694122.1 F-box/kelch-repeat protein SKIP25 [Hibiscus syriacus]